MSATSIAVFDEPNRKAIAQGRPIDWQSPQPKEVYDLVVVGGNPAGVTAAVTASKAGHIVAVSVAAGAGMDEFLGDARFVGADAIGVDGRRLKFEKASNMQPPSGGIGCMEALSSEAGAGRNRMCRR